VILQSNIILRREILRGTSKHLKNRFCFYPLTQYHYILSIHFWLRCYISLLPKRS